jgi:hypothetical protein
MRQVLLIISLCLALNSTASAVSLYNTSKLSCIRLKAILKSDGIAILRYPSSREPTNILYDHFSANSNRCKTGGRGKLFGVQSSDTKACRVHKCVREYFRSDN